jgi:hypothetical protein
MFANNAPFVMTASRIYQDDFVSSGYKIGDTLQVRRQNHFIVGDGSVATPQSIIETVESIVVAHQYHALIAYTIRRLLPPIYRSCDSRSHYSNGKRYCIQC